MQLKDRIIEFRRIRAGDIQPHPQNWRTHGESQKAVMKAILGDVGIANVLITFPADGLGKKGNLSELMTIDGHLRSSLDPDAIWPVAVTDLTRDEADKLIAAFDPVGAMAGCDAEKLKELLDVTEFASADVRRLLDDLLQESIDEQGEDGRSSGASTGDRDDIEKMDLQPEEHYDSILILADNVNDWNRLVKLFDLPYVASSRTHRRIGLSRAVRASKVLELIDG